MDDDGVFNVPLSLNGLEIGVALLNLEAKDRAGNQSTVSRLIMVTPDRRKILPRLSLPVAGAEEGPYFLLAGRVDGLLAGDKVHLMVDGKRFETLEHDDFGRFSREFGPEDLSNGPHEFHVEVVQSNGEQSVSETRGITYKNRGSWILLDGYAPGTIVGSRPLITGRSGYYLGEVPEGDDKAMQAHARLLKENRPERVEVSLDGGRSFSKGKGTSEWKYRIETGELPEGDIALLVRAEFPDGWVYTRTMLHLDKSLPVLKLHENIAGGHFNDKLVLSGLSEDERELVEVSAVVRPGSKDRYEVPAFIQGLYFDASILGATWFDVGLGLTFFDDNVKLQFQVGYAPEYVIEGGVSKKARVYGLAVGVSLLANLAYIPLDFFFGPDWEHLSISFAVGTNFTWFSKFGDGDGGIVSSVMVQMEIPKIVFPDRKFLTYVAPYIEGQVWFFSSDVSAGAKFVPSVGVRVGLL